MKALLAATVLALCSATAPAARVEMADARILDGQVIGIAGGEAVLETDKGNQSIPIGQVVEITFAQPADPMAGEGRQIILTAAGDCLVAKELLTDGRKVRAATDLFGAVEIPVDALRRMYMPASGQTAGEIDRRWQEMKLPEGTSDRLVVARADGQLIAIDGVLEEIGAKSVGFRWQDASRKVGRETVRAVFLAAVSAAASPHRGVLVARDGSTLQFTELGLAGANLSLTTPAVGQVSVPAALVAAIRFRSDNLVNLADLKPAAVKEHGYFDTTFRHRIDRSTNGGPLRLGGRTYRTGLGMHSYCELTWQLGKQFSTFVATVGIDDAVRPYGDATVTILADGKPLGEPIRATGKDQPQTVRLSVKGVDGFLIRVDFGGDVLDFADHVDIAGARLIR